ncbi:hypothetical protein [Streptomyces sp. NPDC017993]
MTDGPPAEANGPPAEAVGGMLGGMTDAAFGASFRGVAEGISLPEAD